MGPAARIASRDPVTVQISFKRTVRVYRLRRTVTASRTSHCRKPHTLPRVGQDLARPLVHRPIASPRSTTSRRNC